MNFDKINEFYDSFLDSVGRELEDPNSVGWSDKHNQRTRFYILLSIGVEIGDSILDYGCGLGHLYDDLRNYRLHGNEYLGIDINPKYIKAAQQRNVFQETANFQEGDIYDITDNYDYVLASGVFTLLRTKGEILTAIAHMYTIANKGIAFNMLSDQFDGGGILNTFSPTDIYNELSKLYPNVELVTDYLGTEDFTIYIRK